MGNRFEGLRRLFRASFYLPDVRRDLDDELDFHLRRTEEALRARGLDQEAARAEARRRFGNLEAYRRDLEAIDRSVAARMRRAEWGAVLQEQIAYALRGVRRAPGFSAGVALTLALGIGANATMFGVIDRLALSAPPGIVNPDQVRRVYVRRAGRVGGRIFTGSTITYPDYRDLQASQSFSSVGAYQSPSTMTVGEGENAERVSAVWATASFLALLGTRPAMGRFFTESEDRIGAPGTAVLGYGYWQSRYGGDPAALGRILDIRGHAFTIIGVAPEGFHGVGLERVDVWLPLHVAGDAYYGDQWENSRGWYWLTVVGRVRSDVPMERVAAEATALHRAGRQELIAQGRYDGDAEVIPAHVLPARGPNAPGEAVVSALLAAVATIVLLIACANVANLMLTRSLTRRREIAVRLAMGVSRRRLIGHLVVEGLVLAALGGLAALAVAYGGSMLMRSVLLPDVAWTSPPIDARVAAFTALASLVTGLMASLLPALQSSRPDLISWLRVGGGGGSPRRSRTRMGLLVTQGALSAVLLVGAGLFVRSLLAVRGIDIGMRTDGLLLAQMELTPQEWGIEDRYRLFERAADEMSRLPGVTRVAVTTTVPFRNSWSVRFDIPELDSIPRPPSGGPYGHGVTPGYFETVGVRLVRGRGIAESDGPGSPQVIVVNESLARGLWPDQDPLGRCVLLGREDDRPCTTVVGVVEDVRRQELIEEEQWQYYLPLASAIVPQRPEGIFVRTAQDRADLIPEIRAAALSVPGVSFATVQPADELIRPQLRPWRLAATMFVAFGLLALAVAGVGLYSVLSFNVAQRTHELGIRAALGATRGRLVRLVFREALGLTATGLAVGLALAALLATRIVDRLYDVGATDPAVFTAVAVGLLLVGAAAGLVPARRASRVAPGIALKAE